jgi:hypothetical protein
MKTKYFNHGEFEFKAYFKPVGHGWEVGLMYRGEPVFVGNFVHRPETTKWWAMMNKEVKTFAKHYHSSPQTPPRWYCNFLSNHVYKCYYGYLDRVFSTHTRHYATAWTKDVKKYKRFYKPTSRAA